MRIRISDIAAGTGQYRLKIVRVLHRDILRVPGFSSIAAVGVCDNSLFHAFTS